MARNRTPTTPETAQQASRWESVKRRYLTAGMCLPCAAQVAWGHQLGFAVIGDPCDICRKLELPPELLARHGDRAVRWLETYPETLF